MGTHFFVLPFLHLGVGRLAADLMLALRARRVPVVAVTCGWAGELGDDAALVRECRKAGVAFERADVFTRDPAVMRTTAGLISEYVQRWRPVVAHAFTAVAAAAVRDCPVVASAVGWSPTKAAWQRQMDVEILEGCAEVTAVSEAVAEELAQAGLRKPPVVILNGVRVPPLLRRASDGPGVVGAVAHLIPRKGIDVLLDALALLPAGLVSRIVIAGTGESRNELREQANRLALPVPVTWAGHIPLGELLPTLDILAVPSRADALPLVLLEGMAAGVPVVASRTGGIPEALRAEEGWLAEPGDARGLAAALQEMIENPAERDRRAARAHAHVATDFSLERTHERYFGVYGAVQAGRVRT